MHDPTHFASPIPPTRPNPLRAKRAPDVRPRARNATAAALAVAMLGCDSSDKSTAELAAGGQSVFRFETFGDEQQWTDQLRLHEVIESAVTPNVALSVGLKVDSDALPPGILATADLDDPATTVALIGLNAVVGVVGEVSKGRLTRVGVTCALCHSTVDDSVAPGIGRRLDGWANTDLNPGAILALSPALQDPAVQSILQSWGPGKYDARFNFDGLNDPAVIPPAYGLADVALASYTGDGDISYWNDYVAVTQMGGQGDFVDPRVGVNVQNEKERVELLLPALRAYQHSLPVPPPPPGSFDATAADRGKALFGGKADCARCHPAPTFTDGQLHAPSEVGTDPLHAQRSATKLYRTTPLRALWQHPPYFHDGSAATLADVVEHYDGHFGLGLAPAEKSDLVEYLKSL